MSRQLYNDLEVSQLCSHCQLLIIDDKAWGGFAFDGLGESRFLVFDEEDTSRTFETEYWFEDSYPDLPSLAESALTGCICCAQIREAVLAARLEPPESATRVILKINYIWKIQGNDLYSGDFSWFPERGFSALLLQVNFMSVTGQESLCSRVISFDIDSSSAMFSLRYRNFYKIQMTRYQWLKTIVAPCATWLRLETSPECDAMNSKNVAWIKRLLHEFEQEAVSVGVKRDDRYLPTRLIDLGVGNEGGLPRLALATDLRVAESRVEYASLSYCWGSLVEAASQYRTTRQNLQQRLAQIDIARTTTVIKDAADVCKALGIRYLWVDSVCIIQDDNVDWEQEAAQMSNVYRNCALTICPMSSSSCSQGFLEKRSHGIDIPFRSRVSPDIVGHYTLRNSVRCLISFLSCGNPRGEDFEEAVWETRAWTFQEYHLSRVLLCFGKRKIHIISRKGIISEGETQYGEIGKPVVSFLEHCIANGEDLDCETTYNHWMGLAGTYCMRQLTYPTDKFPALSGLATYFKGLLDLDDQYLAGLWQKDLHRQLFWMVPNMERETFDELFGPQRSSRQFIAPSWSWAGQSLRFENSHRYFHMQGPFTDYRSEYISVEPCIDQSSKVENFYGQIEKASLMIISRIRKIPVLPKGFHDDNFTDPLWQIKDKEGGYLADCNLDWNGEDDDSDRELDLLLLGSAIEVSENGPFGKDQRYAWGLIICPAARDNKEVAYARKYYRAGIFYSKPKGKAGLSIFEGCDNKTVCLI
ncbi:heterokaryon incompatibility protein-domain-containing protein [Xylaria castorea]|nr:heterokaryon incompatibility protein-domain-containing protein [Xylaria castorea]